MGDNGTGKCPEMGCDGDCGSDARMDVYYFDDIIGTETELYNDYTGERLSINEFNSEKIISVVPNEKSKSNI